MTAEEALAILDQVLQQHLTDVQEIVFRYGWEGQTYAEMAEAAGYDTGYIKDVGSKLWQLLSQSFGEKVTKNNLQAVLRRYQHNIVNQVTNQISNPIAKPTSNQEAAPISLSSPTLAPLYDWGDAVDVSHFYGRATELASLIRWLTVDRCRVVSILGMGGIGKTSLSVKLAQEIGKGIATGIKTEVGDENTRAFEYVIWRSLRNAPAAEELLADWIRFLSQEQETEPDLPSDLQGRLARLIHYLRSANCLLILDNAETILRSGEYSGYFRPEHEGYGEICKRLAELPHQSCLLITSRESPRPLMMLEGETLPVRAMRLSGISEAEANQILQDKGTFVGTSGDWLELTNRYGGNPLALKIVATTIQELFDGNIAAFLAEGTTVFDDIRYLLGQQFDRLSKLEQSIMYWLAINREPVLIAELQEDLIPAVAKSKLIEAVNILRWRSLIEKTVNHYTQQPVIMEYVVERLIEQICRELIDADLDLLIRHALIKAPVKDYIRDSQIRVILQPVVNRLLESFPSKSGVEAQLNQVLEHLQTEYKATAGYAAGNLLNLFRQLETDLTDYSFAELPIWHAYLQDVPLHQVDFSQTQIHKSVFAQTLGSILALAFSPDGQLLASSDAEGEICLWQVSDGKQLFTCKEGQNQWVWSVCFSPDSRLLASSSEDRLIRLWDVATGELVQELSGHSNWVFSVAFSPDGKQLASASEDQTVRLWNLEGECLAVLKGHRGGVRAVAFSPNGQLLASCSSDQTVRLWRIDTEECLHVWEDHMAIVRSLDFSRDGRWLVSGSDDQTLRLWNIEAGDCERVFSSNSRIWSVAFSPSSQFLLSGSDDQQLCLWEISTNEPIRSFEGHTGLVLAVGFSPDGEMAVSGSDDQTIKFWQVDTGRCLKTVKGHNNWVWSVDFSPVSLPVSLTDSSSADSPVLASGNEDGTVRIWQVDTGRCTQILEGHSGRVWSVAYSPRGQILASGSDDQTIRFWRTGESRTAKRLIKTLRGQTGAVRLVKFSPDGLLLASNSGDCAVKLWDVSGFYTEKPERSQLGRVMAGQSGEWVSGQCVAVLEEHKERVFAIAFSPDGRHLATGSSDQTVRVWDTTSGTCLNTLEAHIKPVEAVAFSRDSRFLASGSDDETVRLWDYQTGECLDVLTPQVGRVLTLAFSPNSLLLAIGGSEQMVALWELEKMESVRLIGHSKIVQTLCFSPDGQHLATGSEDETIRIWQVADQTCRAVLRAARPYELLNLTEATGLTAAQKMTLKLLGAIED